MECDFEDPKARWHHKQEKGFLIKKIFFIILIIITSITITIICVYG